MKFIPFFAVLLAGLAVQAQHHAMPASDAANNDKVFTSLADQYFDKYYFRFNPSSGTAAGFHQYDTQLEDYSKASLDQQVTTLKNFQKVIAKIDPLQLSAATRVDHTLVLNDINARLLSLENIRQWEKNPDLYSSGVTNSIFVIMARTFAPPAERLKSVIAREKQVPAVFQAARQNLKNPPPIYVDVALEQIPGLIGFFQKDVPDAFKDVKDQALLAQFQTANQKVMDELKSYGQWLEKDLKPQAHGDFRIGADNYSKKLLYDEDVDIPLARLLEIGMANLRLNQQAFKETAAKLDPSKTPQEILAELEKDHPAPDKLLQTFRDTLGGLKDFLSQHHIVKLPSRCCPLFRKRRHLRALLRLLPWIRPDRLRKLLKKLSSMSRCPSQAGRRNKSKSICPASIAGPSSPRRCTRFILDTTRSFCGCHTRRQKCASCWGAAPTLRAGPITANR